VKIGFVNTFSGGAAIFGKHQMDGFQLALDHQGRKLGGLEVEVLQGDDQQKADVGRQVVDGFLKKDKVDYIVGITWSNVLAAVQLANLEELALVENGRRPGLEQLLDRVGDYLRELSETLSRDYLTHATPFRQLARG